MKQIKINKGALLHAYNRHHINRSTIQRAINEGVRSIVEDPKNNSIIIFTTSKLAVAVDHKYNMKTAFWYRSNYYTSKMNLGKVLENNN